MPPFFASSTCLIAVSYGEGYGLQLIEAAQQKLPIIARDISVFREAASNYAYYFEHDKDLSMLSKALLDWLRLHENGNHPKSDEMRWLTWKESAQQLIKAISL